MYIGITDGDWYRRLSALQPDEVNFWKPGEFASFGSLSPGEIFLFKLHAPNHFIVGGAHFVRFSRLPASLAWAAFGWKNGVDSYDELLRRVGKYRPTDPGPDPSIGNIVLTQPFWFPRETWIPVPSDWPMSSRTGKTYDSSTETGRALFDSVQGALMGTPIPNAVAERVQRYTLGETKIRLGQGGFRVVVTEAYERRCAITGETTLPVLEASHIRPYSKDGDHVVSNGLLLRSDMHTLFDSGLISVTPDMRVIVSPQIQDQYCNGKLYYSYEDQHLRSLPNDKANQPSRESLEWHNACVFRKSA